MPSRRKSRRANQTKRFAHMLRIALIEKLEDRAAAGSMLISLPGGVLSLLPDVTPALPYGLPDPLENAAPRNQPTWASGGALATELPKSSLPAPSATSGRVRPVPPAVPASAANPPAFGIPASRSAAAPREFDPSPFDPDESDAGRKSAGQSRPSIAAPDAAGGGSSGPSSGSAGGGGTGSSGSSGGSPSASATSAGSSGGYGGEGEAAPAAPNSSAASSPAASPSSASSTPSAPSSSPGAGAPPAPAASPSNAPPADPLPSPPSITLRDFPADLAAAGWQPAESGGIAPDAGTVTVVNGDAVLCEGNSFLVTLSHAFTVPDNSGDLAFTYADLQFDTTDSDSINDAFEVALVDQDGFSIVPPFSPSRDAFFNIAEELPAALGAGVTQEGQTVTVSLADVPPGLEATLIFRLVNNDADIGSCVSITGVGGIYQNEPPVIDPLPELQASEGNAIAMSATFTDSGSLDTHTAAVDWGDGTTGAATVTESNGQGIVSADHVYADNDVYSVTLTVTDNSGDAATADTSATITNVAPAIDAALNFEAVLIGSQYSVGVVITGTFTDPGFDQAAAGTQERFTLEADWGDGENGTGAIEVTQGLPGILTEGTFTATHTYTTGGTFDVTATVCDDDGGCVSQSFRYGVVLIDIKPAVREHGGSGYDASLPEGLIPVVMFAAPMLDSTQIAPLSLRFYPGNAPEWDSRLNFVDAAPQDGRTDAVAHFSTWDARIQPTDAVGWVIGQLSDGTPFLGVDVIGAMPASARIPFAYADLPDWLRFGTPWAVGEGESPEPTVPTPRRGSPMSAQGNALGSEETASPIALKGQPHPVNSSLVPPFQGSGTVSHNQPRALPWADLGLPLRGEMLHVAASVPDANPVSESPVYVSGEGESTPPFSSGLYGPNPSNPLDVNADGTTTPQDALLLINAVNEEPSQVTPSRLAAAAPAAPTVYLDVTGDGLLTPIDVLWVINGLNALAMGLDPPTPPKQPDAPPPQSAVGDTLLGADGQVTFTTSADFQTGTLFNVNVTNTADQLTLNPGDEITTFPFIWISNSGEGTISRFDTRTGIEIGRYRTGPTSGTDPSRIAVTPDGDAWVANRADNATIWGNAVKVLREGFVDRNGNDVVDTCQDLNGDGSITGTEILPWDANADGQPDDERIALVVHAGRDRANPSVWQYGGGARGILQRTKWTGRRNHCRSRRERLGWIALD